MSIRSGKYTLSEAFKLSTSKLLKSTVGKLKNSLKRAIDKRLLNWKNLVVNALSKNIASMPNEISAKSHSATKDRVRLFPYMRTGHLRDSVKIRSSVREDTSGAKLIFSAGASIRTPRAIYTNDKAHKNLPSAWLGWMDDVLEGDGRGKVTESVRDIFTSFAHDRRNYLF